MRCVKFLKCMTLRSSRIVIRVARLHDPSTEGFPKYTCSTIRQCKSCSVGRPGIAGERVQAPEPRHQSPARVVEETVPQEETAHQEETKDDGDVGSTKGRTLADRGERTDGVHDFVGASTLASNRAVRDSQICAFPQTVYLLSGCWCP